MGEEGEGAEAERLGGIRLKMRGGVLVEVEEDREVVEICWRGWGGSAERLQVRIAGGGLRRSRAG